MATVGDLIAGDFGLELVAGDEASCRRMLKAPELQKPGLALAGHLEGLERDWVQVLDTAELSFISRTPVELARRTIAAFCEAQPVCLVAANSAEVPVVLTECCTAAGIPLLRSHLDAPELMRRLRSYLGLHLNPTTSLHGGLIDVFGVGVLLRGKSGVGKSEIALELVTRGQRLVADDVVEVRRASRTAVVGRGPELIRHHMEVAGLGIINVRDLFGATAIRDSKRIEVSIELVEWSSDEEYDRLGLDDHAEQILGVDVPYIRLPVRPGRSMTSIVEVAARNQLLKVRGQHSARAFQARLTAELSGAPTRRKDDPLED